MLSPAIRSNSVIPHAQEHAAAALLLSPQAAVVDTEAFEDIDGADGDLFHVHVIDRRTAQPEQYLGLVLLDLPGRGGDLAVFLRPARPLGPGGPRLLPGIVVGLDAFHQDLLRIQRPVTGGHDQAADILPEVDRIDIGRADDLALPAGGAFVEVPDEFLDLRPADFFIAQHGAQQFHQRIFPFFLLQDPGQQAVLRS